MAQSVAKKLEPIMPQIPKRGRPPTKKFICLEPLCGQTWLGVGNSCLIHPRGRKEEVSATKNSVKVRRRILYVDMCAFRTLPKTTGCMVKWRISRLKPATTRGISQCLLINVVCLYFKACWQTFISGCSSRAQCLPTGCTKPHWYSWRTRKHAF